LILILWIVVLYLILPQYLHNDKQSDNPKPLSLGRLIQRIQMEPHMELIPLALVESTRALLF
jgi:hypothetical protein